MENYIKRTFARSVDLPETEIFDEGLTLGQVIAASQVLHNSVDLMEAFAKTANALKKDHGIRVKLPAFPLDTPMVEVLASFREQGAIKASVMIGAWRLKGVSCQPRGGG